MIFYVSIYSVVNSVIFMSLFITFFYICLKFVSTEQIMRVGPKCLLLIFLLLALRSIFCIDSDIFYGVYVDKFLPKLYSLLRYRIIGNLSIASIIIVIWLLGSLIYLIKRFIAEKKYYSLICLWECNHYLESIVESVCDEMNIRVRPKVVSADNCRSPFIIGLKDPIIAFPTFMGNWDIEILKKIINHELIHYKNKDIYLLYFIELFNGLYWWNPLMPSIRRMLRECIELKTDKAVLFKMSNSARLDYCDVLMKIAYSDNENFKNHALSFYSPCMLKSRVFNILSETKESNIIKGVVVLLTIAICIVSIPISIVPEYKPPQSVIILSKDNSTILKCGEVYQVFYEDKLLFETKNIESLPY